MRIGRVILAIELAVLLAPASVALALLSLSVLFSGDLLVIAGWGLIVLSIAGTWHLSLTYFRGGESELEEVDTFPWILTFVGATLAAVVAAYGFLFAHSEAPRAFGPYDMCLLACVVWIPLSHLRLMMWHARRANNALEQNARPTASVR